MSDRIFYAIQAVGIEGADTGTGVITWLHGVQSVGVTTNFNLEQVFELGQLALYQNVENVPEIEVTTERVLDGYPCTYLSACSSGNVDITKAAAQKAGIYLIIYPDTVTAVSGNVANTKLLYCSGMKPSNITYTFPVEGNATESVTFVGNNKVWQTGALATGQYPTGNYYVPISAASYDSPTGILNSGTVFRRQHFVPASSVAIPLNPNYSSKFPQEVIDASGKIQSVTITADIGRENIYELGYYRPYVKYANFPVSTTCDIEVISLQGDKLTTNLNDYTLSNQTIVAYLRNGPTGISSSGAKTFKVDLGSKNKLSSVNYTGGDTGGGNATMTFSYQGFNAFTVTQGTLTGSPWS
jgi:hypothetical protein